MVLIHRRKERTPQETERLILAEEEQSVREQCLVKALDELILEVLQKKTPATPKAVIAVCKQRAAAYDADSGSEA